MSSYYLFSFARCTSKEKQEATEHRSKEKQKLKLQSSSSVGWGCSGRDGQAGWHWRDPKKWVRVAEDGTVTGIWQGSLAHCHKNIYSQYAGVSTKTQPFFFCLIQKLKKKTEIGHSKAGLIARN